MSLFIFQCVAIPGRGFIRGSYKCVCQDGFYFPHSLGKEYPEKAFNGTLLEYLTDDDAAASSDYECVPCAPGCDTCEDNSPCLYSNNLYLRSALLILTAALLILSGLTSVVLIVYKERKVRVFSHNTDQRCLMAKATDTIHQINCTER